MTFFIRSTGVLVGLSLTLWLAGCSSRPPYKVPVEDRLPPKVRPVAPVDPRTQPVKQPPGFENAGKAGYYTVKPGDTLIRIGLDNGQSYKDISRWNGIDNPNRIEVGQVLRVMPPTAAEVATAKPVSSAVVTTTALPAANSATASNTKPVAQSKPATAPSQQTTTAPTPAPAATNAATSVPTTNTEPSSASSNVANDEELGWIWPSKGPLLAGFEDPKNKGVDIGGAAGDPVVAAADGKVVYAGAGLRGYGNLVILKHNATYLTAYAHNQSLAVKEDQTVKKGQKIAEMGSTDAEKVQLHFEVRRQGRPVDPLKYLPAR